MRRAPDIFYFELERGIHHIDTWAFCYAILLMFPLSFFNQITISIKTHWHFKHQSSAAGTCLPSTRMHGRVSERWTLSRQKLCTPKKEGQMSTSVNPELIVSNYSSCGSSLEIWPEKNKISLPKCFPFFYTAFLRLISICSLPSSQILCLGRIN